MNGHLVWISINRQITEEGDPSLLGDSSPSCLKDLLLSCGVVRLGTRWEEEQLPLFLCLDAQILQESLRNLGRVLDEIPVLEYVLWMKFLPEC
ncbi:hypothetical protein QYF36_025932 [Acer negundo]|nr:hypothetical protein QYF36_025932 [Acer negundo]